jgi:hypothetical protein
MSKYTIDYCTRNLVAIEFNEYTKLRCNKIIKEVAGTSIGYPKGRFALCHDYDLERGFKA